MEKTFKIVMHETPGGRRPFEKWIDSLDAPIQRLIAIRIDRVSIGNFGDCEPLRDGVWELKIHTGPGYRIYFGKKGSTIIIILTGGLKRTQEKDIDKSVKYWKLYKEQHG